MRDGEQHRHDAPLIPDAEPVPPGRPQDGPPPRMHVYVSEEYPPGDEPLMHVRWQGRWLLAPVRARADWADGRVVYHVDLRLWRGGCWGSYPYALLWGTGALRPL
jgi:hypothetical protein